MFPDESFEVFLVELFYFPWVASAMAERESGGRGERSVSRLLWRKGSVPRTLGRTLNTRLEKSQETIEVD